DAEKELKAEIELLYQAKEKIRGELEDKLAEQGRALSEAEEKNQTYANSLAEAEKRLQELSDAKVKAEAEPDKKIPIVEAAPAKAECECCGKTGLLPDDTVTIQSGQSLCLKCHEAMKTM
ncbi:MAG: hypothetical protein KAJ07_07865, partial [Planctomycetes bacterium]|nr:hypothetical protein [Planctomycetota bacterium]